MHESKGQAKDSVVDKTSGYIQLLTGKGNIGILNIVYSLRFSIARARRACDRG